MKKLTVSEKAFVAFFFLLLFSTRLYAQKKVSLDVDLGVVQSIGQNLRSTYVSKENVSIYYYRRLRFESPYFKIVANPSYALNSRFSIGINCGLYTHFNEHYSGYKNSLFATFSLSPTARINLLKLKSSNSGGIDLAAGRNFFHMGSYPLDRKNGWLYAVSAFYSLKKKYIVKVGIEKQVDNSVYFYTTSIPTPHTESFRYNLDRLALFLSCGYIF